MLEDKILAWQFRKGSRAALRRIYEKYYDYLLTVATALLHDVNAAEDVVHDSFLKLSKSAHLLNPQRSLKWYLVACVSNRARDILRGRRSKTVSLDESMSLQSAACGPESAAIRNEEMKIISDALKQLPYEQKEVVVLHTRGRMTFKAIAELRQVSVRTVHSQYRYGLDKLKTILNGQVKL
ncbi:MAG: sigma-70 family RNA polymerase sigma factor [Planctomycetes bacterium]|nr:sigma-70 family RNA polymerase sigma factor [Planctomycetota bacterium]